MKFDFGRVFSNSWAMIKQRFWLLIAMWFVFLAIQMVYSTLFGGVIGGAMLALGFAGTGFDDPNALLGGLGVGLMLFSIVFYVGYLAVTFAQQASLAALGSPISRSNFGDALTVGLKAGLTFTGSMLLLLIGFGILFGVAALLSFALSFLGESAVIVASLLALPALIYFSMRFVVIIPVIAVERVFNPVAAIRRTWHVTRGKVVGAFLVTLTTAVLALVMIGIPFLLMFGAVGAMGLGDGDVDGAVAFAAIGSIMGALLLFIPLFILYSIVSVVINACLHAEITDSETERLEQTFS